MHDVVLLHRCYPSTPHGVGPWLPAPSSAPQPELPHWFASLGAQAFTCLVCHGSGEYALGMCDACWGVGVTPAFAPAPDAVSFTAWLECNGHFVTWVSSAAEPHFWTFDRPATVTFHYLPDPTVVYDATGHDQRGACGPSCNCPF